MTNNNHIDRNHPVRVLLREAVGSDISRERLAVSLDAWDDKLPEGSRLSRFRDAVVRGAAEVRALGHAGDQARARSLADELAAQLAGRMTDAERGVSGDANPEPIDSIAARMFTR